MVRPAESAATPGVIEEPWSQDEDKILEDALAQLWDQPDRCEQCARFLSRRDAHAVRLRLDQLERDVLSIEDGRVKLPDYPLPQDSPYMATTLKKPQPRETERRKGVPWTEEEHRQFLLGLAKFGKGDWRSISRVYVASRTPTQVASHAQKYFIRLNSQARKDKRRASIHDITCHAAPGTPLAGGGQGEPGTAALPFPAAVEMAAAPLGHLGALAHTLAMLQQRAGA